MKLPRLRLSTVMLLVVIAALLVALAVSEKRAAQHEAELRAKLKDDLIKLYSANPRPTKKVFGAGSIASASRP
jgi:hypothetical protein